MVKANNKTLKSESTMKKMITMQSQPAQKSKQLGHGKLKLMSASVDNRHARCNANMSFNLPFLILNLPSHGVQFSHSNTSFYRFTTKKIGITTEPHANFNLPNQ